MLEIQSVYEEDQIWSYIIQEAGVPIFGKYLSRLHVQYCSLSRVCYGTALNEAERPVITWVLGSYLYLGGVS